MPWNDNIKPGPWGSGPGGSGGSSGDGEGPNDDGKSSDEPSGPRKGPWGGSSGDSGGGSGGGRGPGRLRKDGSRRPPLGGPGGPKGPDLDELAAQLRERFERIFGGGRGRGVQPGAFAAIGGVAVALWAMSGFYVVQPDQEAVVTRFGAYSRSEGPGLRYRLPGPIEHMEKISVTSLNRLDIGGASGVDVPEESLMLTGDENIVDLNFSVQWRINNAANYLFRVKDPEPTVKMVSESAMREVIGKTALQAILTTGRGQVQSQTAELMQRILDNYGAGVSVVEVQIRTANPPAEVIAAFRSVANAGQDAEASINEAKGDASKITQSAEGYREQVVRVAGGEASRFSQIETEYRRAPDVTRQRLYLETMERVLRASNKVVVDGKGGTAPIVLPSSILRRDTPTAAVQAPTPEQTAQTAQAAQAAQGGAR